MGLSTRQTAPAASGAQPTTNRQPNHNPVSNESANPHTSRRRRRNSESEDSHPPRQRQRSVTVEDVDDDEDDNNNSNDHTEAAGTQPRATRDLTDAELRKIKEELGFMSIKWLNRDGTPKTEKEILEIQLAGWKAAVYDHFEKPRIMVHTSGKVKYVYKCRKPGKQHGRTVVREWTCTATSNLLAHFRWCMGLPGKPLLKYSRELLRLKVAQWCAKRGRPFAIVDDDEFEAKGQQRKQEDADGERRGVCGNQGEQRGGSPVAQAYKDVEIITLRTRE
ncbi:hypothetical protein BOTBODRAFT_176238 [Botryobasidium botryosum FD-172 SS1]|uniref:Uncharacterized protein n=1 Tax=Botryobasidium botryosum (strain FD-172 SS1) TaxID=930990 RepID=A0A067MLW1_BOTB1|nr:hypothetical protein BOTBODRAFT_176238 [Botryobasidium botryosum FD-172 SS1]